MYVIISPSKTQDFGREIVLPGKVADVAMIPEWNEQTKQLAEVMKRFNVEELGKMMKISSKLAELNFERFQDWDGAYGLKSTYSPAILAFLGDVYRSFDLESWKVAEYTYAHKHLGILSGFYGLISPLSYIQPYRLEMGTRMSFFTKGGKAEYKNLYNFWSEMLTEKIAGILREERILVNLASMEYSKVINRKMLEEVSGGKAQVIDVDFKVNKVNNKTGKREEKVIAIYAKRARGLMSNWIIKNKPKSLKDLEKFKEDGWEFREWDEPDDKNGKRVVFVKKVYEET